MFIVQSIGSLQICLHCSYHIYKLAKQKHYNNTQTYCYINSVNISNQTYYYQTSKCVYKQNFSTVHHLPRCWRTLFHHTARIHIQILRKLYEYNAGSFQEHKQRKVNRSYTSVSAVSHITRMVPRA